MGGESDRQMGAKKKVRRADTMGGGDDRQMQGAERKRMLFGRTKSGHDYL